MRRLRLAAFAAGLVLLPLSVTAAYAGTAAEQPGTLAAPTAEQLLAKVTGCTQISAGTFATDSGRPPSVPVCGTPGSRTAPVWWHADMDIDCDGVRTAHCNEQTDPWYQDETALSTSQGRPFQADLTRYFVIPQHSAAASNFQNAGIRLGDVAAIIYNNRLIYAVLADTGPTDIIGEASYAAARALGIDPNPATGGTGAGATYIVFPGARPSPVESHDAIDAKGIVAATAFAGS